MGRGKIRISPAGSAARDQDGFSLLEVLAAVAIMALVFLSLWDWYRGMSRAVLRAEETWTGMVLGENKAAELAMDMDHGNRGRFDPPFDAYHWEIDDTGNLKVTRMGSLIWSMPAGVSP